MDSELLTAIRALASTEPRIKLLDPDDADRIRRAVAVKFGFAHEGRWWWEGLPGGATTMSYEGGDGLRSLAAILPQNDRDVFLFVTDDETPPWPAVAGPAQALIAMLGEQRFFEYFVVDPEMRWIVFDTHHNQLISLGEGLRS